MSILNEPDHIIQNHLTILFSKVDWEGGWSEYATYCGGEANSGIPELDEAVSELYAANERVHLIANKLRIKYDVEWE